MQKESIPLRIRSTTPIKDTAYIPLFYGCSPSSSNFFQPQSYKDGLPNIEQFVRSLL